MNGFLNAALRRSGKTILVEGVTDKIAIHKICIERGIQETKDFVVDHAGILEGAEISGFGNKKKVETLKEVADFIESTLPILKQKLGFLIDREWDDLEFEDSVLKSEWLPPRQASNCFVTVGHSIENYSFEPHFVGEYLKLNFSEYLTAASIEIIVSRIHEILVLAICLSLAVRDEEVISRVSGVLDIAHVEFRNGRFILRDAMAASLHARGIAPSVARNIVRRTNAAVESSYDLICNRKGLQWLPHGHIGVDILWVCVAVSAMEMGVQPEVAARVAHEHKRERERFSLHLLAKKNADERIPLDLLVDWLEA